MRHLLISLALLGLATTNALAQAKPTAPAPKAATPAQPPKDPYADGKLVDGEPPAPASDSFTFAVLPDTQNYSEKYPDTFKAQTRWILANREKRRIGAVFHLGDITNHNNAAQWTNARAALEPILKARLPLCIVPGNHDYGAGGGAKTRDSLMSEHLPVKELARQPGWGGAYDKEPARSENSYHRLDIAGRKFLVLCLEFGPRDDVLRWANEVVAANRDREAILLTHAHIFSDDTRYNQAVYGKKQTANPINYGLAKLPEGANEGEGVWEKLLSRHETFILTLNGHVAGDGLGRLVTKTPGGRPVPQVVVNFQFRPKGGDGWLRLVEMRKDGTMRMTDYSPVLNKTNVGPQNTFAIPW
jgi:calcineurin-like phosphoesterase family protein